MKTAKGVIFDFNGTLFFDTKFHIKAFKEKLEEAGKPVPDDHYLIKNVFGKPNSTVYREFFDPNATDEAVRAFANSKEDKYIAYCVEHPEFMHLVHGAPEMLDYLLDNKIPYALATGSDLRNVEFYLSELGISKWFNFNNITYADGIIKGKPEPDVYITAANKMGLDPSECIVFEDAGSGFKAANAAGCRQASEAHGAGSGAWKDSVRDSCQGSCSLLRTAPLYSKTANSLPILSL